MICLFTKSNIIKYVNSLKYKLLIPIVSGKVARGIIIKMKANRLVFDNLVDISPRTGVIKFNEKRMILTSTEAMGFLRRDLIRTLGVERAKSLLLRYGWANGYNAARSIKKAFPWRTKEELILAGPALHTLAGPVMVETDEIRVDNHSFYMRGSWFYSYEYEEHVKHFNFSDEGVCWTLIGFIKGYLTCVYDKDIIVYEETCKGKQDHQCTFVACSLNLCPPQHLDSSRYFDKECLVSEFDSMYQQLEQTQLAIQRADLLGKKMTNALLEEKNLSFLLQYVSEELGFSVLAERNMLRKPFETYFIDEFHEKIYDSYSRGEQLPEGGFIEVFPIKSEKAYYGKLVLIGHGRLKDTERCIAERSIMSFLWYFNTQHKVVESTWKKKIDLFEQLLDHQINLSETNVDTSIFDIDITRRNRVIVIQSDIEDAYALYLSVEKLLVSDVFMKDQCVVILTLDEDERTNEMATQLLTHLMELFPDNKIYLGIGRQSESLSTFIASYEEAFKLSNFLVHCSSKKCQIAHYEQLKHVLLFLKTADPAQLFTYYNQVIGKLIDYDKRNDAQLILTLQTFFDFNGNINKTAQQLNLSIPGLRYRMEKIESLIDADLKSGDGRFQCQLALQFYYAIQAISK